MVAVSIVSHGHGKMVAKLITQLLEFPEISRILITKNISEELLIPKSPKILVVENKSPKGFGENHNFAFSEIKDEYFCPLNPDISLLTNPFPRLIESLKKYDAELVAPMVLNENGGIEDSARYFPTMPSLIKKLFFKTQGCYDLTLNRDIFSPEWVAGMFMFFKSSAYKKLNGFDNKYYLYYEDVDICIRLWKAGMRLIVDPSIFVVHDARRASRHNFSHMKMHLKSMLIYLFSHFGRLPKITNGGDYE
jgi:N-acetylglucosaminyl-diphospho-decaprenol L-rhamnosyltransferase